MPFDNNQHRLIRNASVGVSIHFLDEAGTGKLNVATIPTDLVGFISRDNAAYDELAEPPVAFEVDHGVVVLADDEMDWHSGLIKVTLTGALSPLPIGPLFTEPCIESGRCGNTGNTTSLVNLRAGAPSDDMSLKLIEIVSGTLGTLNRGLKRITTSWDDAGKLVGVYPPLPEPCDNFNIYKITELTQGDALQQLLLGGVKMGVVTGGASASGCTVAALAGLGAAALLNSAIMILSAAGTNSGLIRQVTTYTTGTGAFVFDALPATVSVGDLVLVFGSFG